MHNLIDRIVGPFEYYKYKWRYAWVRKFEKYIHNFNSSFYCFLFPYIRYGRSLVGVVHDLHADIVEQVRFYGGG